MFARGEPQEIALVRKPLWEASLHDLLTAYARQREKHALSRVTIQKRFVWSLGEAREALERLMGRMVDWAPLDSYLVQYAVGTRDAPFRLRVGLRLGARDGPEGHLELRQDKAFDKLWMRRRTAQPPTAA